jgi:cytochrome c553
MSKTQVRDKVGETLAAAAQPASAALLEILEQWMAETCPTCHHPTGEPGPVIKAAQIVLDRTGFHPTLTLQSGGRAVDPEMERIASYLTTEQLIQVHEWIEDARRRIEQSVPIIDVVPITEAALTVHRPTEPEE